ncbi:phosphatase PAP2 family protein [Pseudoalteromonas luteoviolacea]|uniref:undecaprenyl-diphosphate phosphatase n=1 Tax=Pseudoalteromonas luteoviolacea H33 TaxID=1365251 RepID=A0A167DKS1_9GAMM|nr:phosphatase PAP2 family protein [Pseudoalteromonas luteoviolacea]KZN48973.1 phosphoesterase PA-phosphatase [Pseudoalteromonas luteoviolacea H33]KZN74353.1 phosphoesterase PA-phosphatase [Pseudoalteromonas luteoviolacea H33-S]MBQ4878565.1 phosphatase PAP2 family protein [Pseudoalteromonas luteoviolacea]MBQ4907720.1 phosphatase PAP2 family protein [Pseudoalteromonas luteoviolacea]
MKAQIIKLDTALYFALYKPKRRKWFNWLMLMLSKSGNGGLYVILALLNAYFMGKVGNTFVQTVLLAFAIERPLYFLLKKYFARARPCDCLAVKAMLTPSDKFSMPSGHSAGAWLYATCLMEVYPVLTIPLCVWAAGVSLSRVLVGVHYPIDVILGALMGSGCAMLAIGMLGDL